MATNIDFTTTARKARSDAVDNLGKIGTTAAAALTSRELQASRELIQQSVKILDVATPDSTMTFSLSLTSGSIVALSCTI